MTAEDVQLVELLARLAPADRALLLPRLGAAGPGRRTLFTEDSLARRDAALGDAARRWWPDGMSKAARAELLHQALSRYRACAAWDRDRAAESCPEQLVGTMRESLWTILRARDHVPSARRIRAVLGH